MERGGSFISGMKSENSKIRQYLLGNLEQKEIEELDLQVISDDGLEEKFIAAEHELIEDYLEETLSPDEKELFRTNFLISQERKKLLQDISLLKKYSKNRSSEGKTNIETTKDSNGFFRSLKSFFSISLSPAAAGFALLFIGLAALGIWQIFLADTRSPLEKEYAVLNERDLSNSAEFSGISNASLFPGKFRDTGAAENLKEKNLSERVFLRLALPFEIESTAVFKFTLEKDEKAIFKQNLVRVYQNAAGGKEARLLVPKSVLTKGQYQIKLEDASGRDLTISYRIEVE